MLFSRNYFWICDFKKCLKQKRFFCLKHYNLIHYYIQYFMHCCMKVGGFGCNHVGKVAGFWKSTLRDFLMFNSVELSSSKCAPQEDWTQWTYIELKIGTIDRVWSEKFIRLGGMFNIASPNNHWVLHSTVIRIIKQGIGLKKYPKGKKSTQG